ncbi:MAG: DUF1800 domain-containing protein [Armatimonadetes bacterium]|nr:DUF1800 domain-containing protein [Armatimonadota bacterium]
MTERDKIVHLLRRFGLGAAPSEVDAYEKIGLNRAIDDVLDFEKPESRFPVSPWEFFFQEDGQVQLNANRLAGWWVMRLIHTDRPSLDKLTIFWHDHFAVSAQKVESGVLMLYYLETLTKHAGGAFRDLLGAITKDPAMMRWLDSETNIKGNPNENYGRELLELFTIGIGNYTEKDVQETARALTGWSLRTVFRQGDAESTRRQIVNSITNGPRLITAAFSRGLHDETQKTILGKADTFDTEGVLYFLAGRPETARYITTKLWEYYAYPNPERVISDRLTRVFTDSKGDIKSVLLSILNSDEFWSDRCARALIKSPVDLTIAFIRQLEISEQLLEERDTNATETTPIPQSIIGIAGALLNAMNNQGMLLLYPPDVAGWTWGQGWISTNNMLERIRFADLVAGPSPGQSLANAVRSDMLKQGKRLTSRDVVDVVLERFDVDAADGQVETFVRGLVSGGGVAGVMDQENGNTALHPLIKLIFAMPEFHLV